MTETCSCCPSEPKQKASALSVDRANDSDSVSTRANTLSGHGRKDSKKRQRSIKSKTQENVVRSKGSSSDHDLHLPIVDGNTHLVPNVRYTQDKRMNTLTTRTKRSDKSATVTRIDRS